MLNKNQTLGEFIIKNQTSFKYSSGELSSLINSIRLAAKVVNHEVNKAGLVDIIGFTGNENIQSCLLYTSPSPRDVEESRMPSSA